jgi:tRNA (guanine37-N1)-methyltransferase
VLLSGDHAAIREWRLVAAVRRTLERRPELLAGITFDQAEKKLLARHGLLAEIEQRGGIFPAAGRKGRRRD